jgi:DNA-directed RNA polymerase subunit RPC12/RpoP
MNEANMSFFDWLWKKKSSNPGGKSSTSQKVKSALYVKIIRACTTCGSSGVNKYGTPYEVCPNCGTKRPPMEDRGRVWVKFWS